jgi:hypothetical protein
MNKNKQINSGSATAALFFIATMATIIAFNSQPTNNALALEQNNITDTKSETPIDIYTVIKQGTQKINNQLDQVRQAIQSNNNSQAILQIEMAKQDLYTLNQCVTANNDNNLTHIPIDPFGL